MIAVRWTYLPKHKQFREFVELFKAQRERAGTNGRIYRPNISPYGKVAIEIEFESLAEYEKWFEQQVATPENAAFLEKLRDLRRPGGSCEIWTLEE